MFSCTLFLRNCDVGIKKGKPAAQWRTEKKS